MAARALSHLTARAIFNTLRGGLLTLRCLPIGCSQGIRPWEHCGHNLSLDHMLLAIPLQRARLSLLHGGHL